MGRARHNPFRGVMDTMSEMNRMREQLHTGNYEGASREEQPRTHATAWLPATDIFADGEDLVIRCELAGVGKEDLEITLSGGALVISGERKSELDMEGTHFLVRERFYGHFRRSINLPDDVDDDDIGAAFRNGMLEVTVTGGADAAKPRHIKITDN